MTDGTRKLISSRALHCYILLSIWILLLVAGLYKFLEPQQKLSSAVSDADLFHNLAVDVKTKRIFKICNLPDQIEVGDEGIFSVVWCLFLFVELSLFLLFCHEFYTGTLIACKVWHCSCKFISFLCDKKKLTLERSRATQTRWRDNYTHWAPIGNLQWPSAIDFNI